MKRIKYGKEPILHVHRYIVAIVRPNKNGNCSIGFRYAVNLKEARSFRDTAAKGYVVEIYKASHDFREAWQK